MDNDMPFFKGRITSLLVAFLCLSVVAGCSTDYSEVDVQGKIVDVNTEETMILVEDQDRGQIWVDVSGLNDEIERLHSPLEVNVWLDESITEDTSTVGKAERIDVIK
ncbi:MULTISPECIES: hypothetical protein [unclassified Exiguobacterium]|uniref:hypothetical protein n=1 Tax=unclassified Exiguobacterium TaxID=2644629 RepID=UPI00103A654F|nr:MULTISPECIES: hypothetical protein [unclassified Exiguobacterium]TCI56024.1 hypothetical protein EVJ30_05025 [Exiguobacterium sp. SH5S13]TCI64916.1 hypothetical protein EVJ26_03900 [Exiguobacterium sp. SH3S1]